MALTYEKVIGVISQSPDKRKDFEVNNLLPWFRKKSDLFRNLKTELMFDIIKNLQFVKKNRDDLIIRQGDQGDCMYILLRGRVTIYIFYNNKAEGDDDQSTQPVINAKTESIRQQLGTFVTHLGAGATFGEVALMNDDAPRTASIIADETTELIVIDRDLYNRSVKNVLKKEFEDKSNFIASNPFFQTWPPKYKKQLAMALQKETFPYEGVLAKQGDPVEAIYFILTGEIKVLMDPTQHAHQYPKLFNQTDESLITNHAPNAPDQSMKADDLMTSLSSAKDRNGMDPTLKFRKPKPKKQSNEVCLLALNESIGDIEVFLDLDSYLQTAICTQKTEVLVMELKHYERLLVKRNPRTIEQMKSNLELRIHSRMTKHIEKTIPILKCLHNKAQEYNLLRAQQSEARQQKKDENGGKVVKTMSATFDTFVPPRGPLIDMYGPGTVFHRIRQRAETKALRAKKGHQLFGGYQGGGAKIVRENGDAGREGNQVSWGSSSVGTSATDEATSDPVLSKLEDRMRQWLRNDPNPTNRQRGEPRIARLQRSQTEAEQDIRPGARVVLRPKPAPVYPSEPPQPLPGIAHGKDAAHDEEVYVHTGHAWV